MAATRLIALHIGKGKSKAKALNDRLDYSQNPDKTDEGELISSYKCDPKTAAEEFLLSKKEYYRRTGRMQENDVIAYQIRQSFKPGEITPEEANKVGYETTMRFTKGKHAFTVSTHIDRAHIHNHIIFNSTTLDCTRKFRDFLRSGLALQVVSDLVCLEHKLSIIKATPGDLRSGYEHDKRKTIRDQIRADIGSILNSGTGSFDEILHCLREKGYEIKPGKHIAIRGKKQKKFIRLDSLGEGYSESELKCIFEAMGPECQKKKSVVLKARFDLLVDIQEKLQQGKGKGYERWAKVFNVKQMAQVLLFLQECGIHSYEELKEKTVGAVAEFDIISDSIKEKEQKLSELQELKTAVISYHRTREIFSAYKASRYSNRYQEEHREEILSYRAAQEVFRKHRLEKFPTVKELSSEYMQILAKKKAEYSDYREKKLQMQELLKAQKNVEMLLEIGDEKSRQPEEERKETAQR